MAITLNTTLRNNRANQITSFAGTSAKLRIYTAGYASQLVECVCNASAFAPAASGGVLTLNLITAGVATAAGTAAIARIYQSDGATMVIEGLTVATSGANINISSTTIAVNDTIAISSATITGGQQLMAITVTHTKVSAIADDPASVAAGEVVPSDWNANHTLSGTVDVNQGGTGASTAANARVNLLPSYTGNGSKALTLNSGATDVQWTTLVDLTSTQTLSSKTLTDPAIVGTILEDVYTISDGAAFEIDPGNGSIQLITLGASRTPKATNFAAGESVTLMVDDGTAYTLTWTDSTFGGSGVVWKTNGGVAPTLNTSGYTVIVLWKVSTQVYGARVGDA